MLCIKELSRLFGDGRKKGAVKLVEVELGEVIDATVAKFKPHEVERG